jgi:hypothetical protein
MRPLFREILGASIAAPKTKKSARRFAMSTARKTIDHDEIRAWVEERGGKPARVKATGSRNDPGILRIDYPGFTGQDTLEEITWDEWFTAFDDNELAMLLQDETSDGDTSRFSKLVRRDRGESRRSTHASAPRH